MSGRALDVQRSASGEGPVQKDFPLTVPEGVLWANGDLDSGCVLIGAGHGDTGGQDPLQAAIWVNNGGGHVPHLHAA